MLYLLKVYFLDLEYIEKYIFSLYIFKLIKGETKRKMDVFRLVDDQVFYAFNREFGRVQYGRNVFIDRIQKGGRLYVGNGAQLAHNEMVEMILKEYNDKPTLICIPDENGRFKAEKANNRINPVGACTISGMTNYFNELKFLPKRRYNGQWEFMDLTEFGYDINQRCLVCPIM